MNMILASIYGLTVPQAVMIVAGLMAVIYIYLKIKEKKNRGAAETGEDKNIVWGIMQRSVPEAEKYTKAYGCWEWETYRGNTKTTTYWYYGIAFNEEQICIVPLSCEGGDISYSGSVCLRKEDLGMINAKKEQNWTEFYDKDRNEILTFTVDEENLKEDKYHPVNIIQTEEAKAFVAWRNQWMDEVNRANGVEVTGKMKKPLKKK